MSFAMNKKQTLNILMASSAAILLQGCAAALVPLAAGGLMGRAAETGPGSGDETTGQTAEAAEANTGVVRVARSEAGPQEQMPVPERADPSEEVPRIAPEQETPPPPPPPEPESTPEPMPVQEIEPEPQEAATPVMDSELAEPMRAAPEPEPPAPVVVQTLPEQADEPEAVPEAAPPESAATTETRVIRIARSQMVDEQPPSISAADAVAAIASSEVAETAAPTAAPTPAAPTAPAARAVSPNAITTLISYTNQQRFEPAGSRSSAILADRITLEPDRAPCLGVRPTILIDLDPDGGVLSPANASRPPSGLAGGLEQLREDGVDVAWISSNPASAANAIRETLRETGLDPYGRDQLLLVRNSDDRKQTLRDGLAESTCSVAIAGDTRSDFDELYDYLLNPEDAASLEPLFGDGWFIIPQPLLSEGSE